MSAAFTYYYRSLDFEKYVQKKYQIQLGGPAEASSQRPDTGEAPGMSAHRLFSGEHICNSGGTSGISAEADGKSRTLGMVVHAINAQMKRRCRRKPINNRTREGGTDLPQNRKRV